MIFFNIFYMFIYLIIVVGWRDFVGFNVICKSIVYLRVLREIEGVVRIEDMWDSGCELLVFFLKWVGIIWFEYVSFECLWFGISYGFEEVSNKY